MKSVSNIVTAFLLSLTSAMSVAQSPGTGQPLPADNPIPPDFRGQMVWRGFYQGKALLPDAGTNVRSNRFSFNIPGSRAVPLGGEYVVTLDVNNGMLSGQLQTSGALDPVTLNGTLDGTTCHLVASDGARSDAYCSRRLFREHVDQTNAQRQRVMYDAQAQVARIANYDMEDRQREAAQAKATADAAVARQAADAAAFESTKVAASLPPQRSVAKPSDRASTERSAIKVTHSSGAAKPAATVIADAVEKAVQADSKSWIIHAYDSGSVHNARIVSKVGDISIVRADYTYARGEEGWVEAQVRKGAVLCLHFWNTNDCTEVRTDIGRERDLRAYEQRGEQRDFNRCQAVHSSNPYAFGICM